MNHVKEFLQRDDMIVPDEYTLHSWVVEWLKEDKRSASIQDNLKEILPLIRFELMSTVTLDSLLEDEFVHENSEVYSTPYILPAFRCHTKSIGGITARGYSQVFRNIRTFANLENSHDSETADQSEFSRKFMIEDYVYLDCDTKQDLEEFYVPVNPSFTDRFTTVTCEVSVYPKGVCITEEYVQNYYDSHGKRSQRKVKVVEDDHFRLDIALQVPKDELSEWEISALVICVQNQVKYVKRVITQKPWPWPQRNTVSKATSKQGKVFNFAGSAIPTSTDKRLVTSIVDPVTLHGLMREDSEYLIDEGVELTVVCKPQYNANKVDRMLENLARCALPLSAMSQQFT
ncbi:uncharacterized protein [Ptychodera flava]|uniref:uncharacterized protein n=1 Tax=Ptychodera flava TaxID=63121 RepID=UPI00396A02A3